MWASCLSWVNITYSAWLNKFRERYRMPTSVVSVSWSTKRCLHVTYRTYIDSRLRNLCRRQHYNHCCRCKCLHDKAFMPQIHYTRFPVTSPPSDGEVACQLAADLFATRQTILMLNSCHGKGSPRSPQQVVVMEFGKRHHTTDTTDFCPRQLVADLLWTCSSLRGNWCNGFWPLAHTTKLLKFSVTSLTQPRTQLRPCCDVIKSRGICVTWWRKASKNIPEQCSEI